MLFDKLRNYYVIGTIGLFSMLVFFGCAHDRMQQDTDTNLRRLYTLRGKHPNQKKVVENFSRTDGENQLAGRSSIFPLAGEKLCVRYQKNSVSFPKGFSLEMTFALQADEEAWWETDLNMLDISQAKALALWIKVDNDPVVQKMHIVLRDHSGHEVILPLARYYSRADEEGRWHEIIIPRRDFSIVNCNSLQKLKIVLVAGRVSLQEKVTIDDIAFVGETEVYFQSLKDNLFGFPENVVAQKKRDELLSMNDDTLLRTIARDTWGYFDNAVDKRTYLPLDSIQVNGNNWIGDYTSPTNIGLYLIACVGAYDLGFIGQEKAVTRINECLKTLQQLPRWKNFHYNYYNTTTQLPTSQFVSTVDCGWLAAGLIVVRQSFGDEVARRASQILDAMDFGELYDENVGQLRLGYDDGSKELSKYHYGLLATEARVASLIGIGKGDLEEKHWFRIYRTLPEQWKWQNQTPQGKQKKYLGQSLFQGYYTYQRYKIVPSWGGSLFEFLMPTLVVNEKTLAPDGLGLNNIRATRVHIEHALQGKQYGVWGLSPCSVVGKKYGGYEEFGVVEIGAKGYNSKGVVTPHVSFLALDVLPKEALRNIRTFLQEYEAYGEYGLYDSVSVHNKKVSYKYLALDQGMTFISVVNYLTDDAIKKKFHSDPIVKAAEHLLIMEKFFE
ncbi:MAG: DUF3131 domain-containing protein [Candidatus Omnitrophica bacterium]|nr:DUF3131 domain-containing protein [Candidatus Omnitrophota bacterium]